LRHGAVRAKLLLKITFMISTSASPLSAATEEEESSEVRARSGRGSLENVAPGESVHVTDVALDADLAAWVKAVGIREGERLVVLRRAAFGGPIHVRTACGGEFALARSVARAVLVRAA
jgi:ferrous iron transport protein A